MWRFALLTRLVPTLALVAVGASADVASPGEVVERAAVSPESANLFLAPPGYDGLAPHNFYFTRAAYTGGYYGRGWGRGRGRGGGGSWETDYPKADRQFLAVLQRLTGVDAYELEHPVRLDDPAIRRYPFIYAVEVGHMSLTDAEVQGLRDFLLAGGFLVCDDFWGSREWAAFEEQIRRVLPEYPIVDLPKDHPIFSSFYDVRDVIQVPNVQQGMSGGPTYEQDGYDPHVRGILDDKGRLLVVINWNTDMGDGWEWAEQPDYPLRFSSYAYRMGANYIVYSMSH
jgi:hypothetical protein